MEKLSTRWNWITERKYFISLSYEHFRLFPSGMFFSSPELFIFFILQFMCAFSFRRRHSKLKSGHNESHFHCSITKLMNERIWNISEWNKSFVLKTSKNYDFYIDKWISNGTSILHSVFLFLLQFSFHLFVFIVSFSFLYLSNGFSLFCDCYTPLECLFSLVLHIIHLAFLLYSLCSLL